mmetsp:Transcript_8098/g.13084  ORF Transcript_8098/g.13084 Transcript_8098/m.13084 type:complete len:161 (+) Transcript_8098:1620-2102(+)
MSQDGKVVASGTSDNTVRVWYVETGATRHVLKGHPTYVFGVDMSHDGRRIVSQGFDDNAVCIWDVVTGQEVKQILGYKKNILQGINISSDGRFVAGAGLDEKVRIWEVDSGRVCAEVQVDGGIARMHVSFNGNVIAAVNCQYQAKLLRAAVDEDDLNAAI